MTKQELASKIWETANSLRSNIKSSEYKDYILGFMFYKYLTKTSHIGKVCRTLKIQQCRQ